MGTIIERNEKLLIFVTLCSVFVQGTSIFVHSAISACSCLHGCFFGGLLDKYLVNENVVEMFAIYEIRYIDFFTDS